METVVSNGDTLPNPFWEKDFCLSAVVSTVHCGGGDSGDRRGQVAKFGQRGVEAGPAHGVSPVMKLDLMQ